MRAPRALGAAAVLGLGGGLRSFACPTALAIRGVRPFAGSARHVVLGAALLEGIADKHPRMPTRWSPRGLSLRLLFAVVGGRRLSGWAGVCVAVPAALLSAYTGSRVRTSRAGERHPFTLALGEDALSYGLALSAIYAAAPPPSGSPAADTTRDPSRTAGSG